MPNCLYVYTIKNSEGKEVAVKVGITTERTDEYAAIEHRIRTESVHNIQSDLGVEFAPGNIYFCIHLGEKRARRYEKVILDELTKEGFQRKDMYTVGSDGARHYKTEFFHMKHKGECVKEAIDQILAHPEDDGILNLDVNGQLWTLCVGCNDYARQEPGQMCDHCDTVWCHDRCADLYMREQPGVVYDNENNKFTCHNCLRH